MRLLLDSHVFLWMHGDPDRLSVRTRAALVDQDHELLLSVVVGWELGLKIASGRLRLPEPLQEYVTSRAHRARMTILPISLSHAFEAIDLPLHHGDPFDRMLVAQARVEGLTIVTADRAIAKYEVDRLRA